MHLFRIEKDCTSWSHERIRNLLSSLTVESCSFAITKVTGIEGDVSVNQRKGRVKQLFDLEIKFDFSASGDLNGTGFISEFTADYEDPSDLNVKLSPAINGKEKDAIIKALGEIIEEFKKELFDVHGKPLLLQAAAAQDTKAKIDSNSTVTNNKNCAVTSDFNVKTTTTTSTVNETALADKSSSCALSTKITDEVKFPCPPSQLYLMLTDPARIRSWTRSPANLPQILLPQAPFSLFDGNISGKFLTLKSPSFIEMEWKLKGWKCSSHVSIEILTDQHDSCVLKMEQTNVPNGEADITKNNWHNYYWNPIKSAFGVIL